MKMMRTLNKQSGSMILEALISILIFSIGILALVGMQATAVSGVADGKYRSTAGFLANQMVGTVWANRLGALLPNASNVMAAIPDPTFACANCASSGAGNAYTLAWATNAAAELPGATTSIAVSASVVTVTIGWKSPKDPVRHHHTVQTFIN
jgi:type IV pilus assembly protein PilV